MVHQLYPHAVLAMVYAKQGARHDAMNEINRYIKPYADDHGELLFSVAAVYSLLGRQNQAIDWLEKAVASGHTDYIKLAHDSNFSTMQKNNRFIQLLDSLHLIHQNTLRSYSLDEEQTESSR